MQDQDTDRSGLPDIAKAYRLQEYTSLREEVLKRLERQTSLEVYTLLACAAVYGFLFTSEADLSQSARPFLQLVWWLPTVLTGTVFLRWKANERMLKHLGGYMRLQHEAHVKSLDASYRGWASYLHQNLSGWHHRITALAWLVLIAVTVGVAGYQALHPVEIPAAPGGKG